jgi:transposase InsO family protein
MERPIRWEADADLAALLRRYYRGEAGLWGDIQARVHADLRRQGLPVAPRHMRFRATDAGYLVIIEDAEGHANP